MDSRTVSAFLGPVLLLALVVTVVRWVTARPLDPVATSVRRRATLATVASAVVAWLCLGVLMSVRDGVAHPAAVPLAASVGVAVAALAERLLPRQRGTVRTTALDVRRGTDATTLRRLTVGGLVAAVAGALWGAATSTPDGVGGRRSLGAVTVVVDRYPGTAYTLGTLAALAGLAVVTWWALRTVDGRPAFGADVELDRAVRLGSRVRVLRWSSAGMLLTAAGLFLTIGPRSNELAQLLRIATDSAARAPWDWGQNLAFAGIAVGVAALLLTLYALLYDAPPVPRSTGSDAAPSPTSSSPPSPGSASRASSTDAGRGAGA